jgi:hypothetical protein
MMHEFGRDQLCWHFVCQAAEIGFVSQPSLFVQYFWILRVGHHGDFMIGGVNWVSTLFALKVDAASSSTSSCFAVALFAFEYGGLGFVSLVLGWLLVPKEAH